VEQVVSALKAQIAKNEAEGAVLRDMLGRATGGKTPETVQEKTPAKRGRKPGRSAKVSGSAPASSAPKCVRKPKPGRVAKRNGNELSTSKQDGDKKVYKPTKAEPVTDAVKARVLAELSATPRKEPEIRSAVGGCGRLTNVLFALVQDSKAKRTGAGPGTLWSLA
jgi:hypothetical protein